jgi:hypothetical protein
MLISEPFRYRNDSFQSNIFSSDIGITDVDVGCRISPILRSVSMPTYDFKYCETSKLNVNHCLGKYSVFYGIARNRIL